MTLMNLHSIWTHSLLIFTALVTTTQASSDSPLQLKAESGDITAQRQLAEHLEHNDKNTQQAIHWYCKAALQKDIQSQQALGWMYMNGRGVKQNDAIAFDWFNRAAQQGDAYAQKMLPYLDPKKDQHQSICNIPIAPKWSQHCPKQQKHCQTIIQTVEQLAPQFNIDPNLALSVIMVESRFNPKARSPKNAQGLMQLIPGTAKRFGVKKVHRIKDNIKGGMAYLQWLLSYYQGNVRWAVAAYNAGEGAVDRYKGIPRYPETQNYVKKVLNFYGKTTHNYRKNWIEASKINQS